MKICRLIFIFLSLVSPCLAQPPKTKDDFVTAVRSAYEAKDLKRIHGLTWESGISDWDRKMQDQMLPMMLNTIKGTGKATWEPVPSDFMDVQIAGGRSIEPTHPADGMLKLDLKTENPQSSASIEVPYAVIDGGYYIVTSKSTDIGWKGPKDKTLNVMVLGQGMEKVGVHVRYNASGVEMERDQGPSRLFPGQYIEEVTVTSNDDDVDVTLQLVNEQGDPYYKSEPLKGKGQIHYKKDEKSTSSK